MAELARVLHNIRDHIVVVRAICERSEAVGGARERLLGHIVAEEIINQEELTRLIASASPAARRAAALALDHSRLLSDIVRGVEIDKSLALELLEHFQEEHDAGALLDAAIADTAAPAPRAAFTVGSLIRRAT